MANKNGAGSGSAVPLSAIDFLGLTQRRKVARIDLAEVGYEGVIYIRDLTAAEFSKITSLHGKDARTRFYKDESYELNLAALAEAAGSKFLMAAAVTDAEDGAVLERAFAAVAGEDDDPDYITIADSELVQMSDQWIREAGNIARAEKMLEAMPNAITNLVVKRVRELSHLLVDDRIEEKKDNS